MTRWSLSYLQNRWSYQQHFPQLIAFSCIIPYMYKGVPISKTLNYFFILLVLDSALLPVELLETRTFGQVSPN